MSLSWPQLDWRHRFGEIGLGLFSLVYAFRMWPVATTLYTRDGILPLAMSESGLMGSFWSFMDNAPAVHLLHALTALAGLTLIFNVRPRVSAFVIFAAQWYLYNRNTFTFAPDTGYTQAFLLILACQAWITKKERLFLGWLVLGVAYSYSGLSKLDSPVWTEGLATRYFINLSDSTRLWVPYFNSFYKWPMMIATWFILAVEVTALGLISFRWGRLLVWTLFAFFHLFNNLIFDFVQLSLGCFVAHLLLLQWALRDSEDFDVFIRSKKPL